MMSSSNNVPNGEHDTASSLDAVASVVRPYSQSPTPVWSLAGLFLTSSLIPPKSTMPPLMHRIGFGAIFAGAGYVLSCGDVTNGSGITTAWSLTYLFLNLRKSLAPPRHPASLVLSTATLVSSVLYGTEYFVLPKEEE